MKNLILIIALSMTYCFASAQHNTAITLGTDIIGFYTDTDETFSARSFNFGLENAFAKRWTLSADASIARGQGFDFRVWNIRNTISSVKTGIKFYPKRALQGFYLGTNLAYTNVQNVFRTQEVPANLNPVDGIRYIGGGVDLGINTRLGNRLTFGAFTGLNVMTKTTDLEEGILQYNLGLKIGFKL